MYYILLIIHQIEEHFNMSYLSAKSNNTSQDDTDHYKTTANITPNNSSANIGLLDSIYPINSKDIYTTTSTNNNNNNLNSYQITTNHPTNIIESPKSPLSKSLNYYIDDSMKYPTTSSNTDTNIKNEHNFNDFVDLDSFNKYLSNNPLPIFNNNNQNTSNQIKNGDISRSNSNYILENNIDNTNNNNNNNSTGINNNLLLDGTRKSSISSQIISSPLFNGNSRSSFSQNDNRQASLIDDIYSMDHRNSFLLDADDALTLTPNENDDTKVPPLTKSGKPRKVRKSHNIIEKKYRTNINHKMIQLKKIVPSLRIAYKKECGLPVLDQDSIDLDGLPPANKLNKAVILMKTIEYIKHLEAKCENYENRMSEVNNY